MHSHSQPPACQASQCAMLKVDSVIYDASQSQAMVFTTQHLTPALLPFLTFTCEPDPCLLQQCWQV